MEINQQYKLNWYLNGISDFLLNADLNYTKKQLLDMYYAAITSRHANEMEMKDRGDLTHFYIILLGLIEGIYWIEDSLQGMIEKSIAGDVEYFRAKCPYNCKQCDRNEADRTRV